MAALAVSASACLAQNVYSLNIVGYVNVQVTNGLNLIANPLKPSNGDYNITNTITLPESADGAQIYSWAGTAWSTTIPGWIGGFGWDTSLDIPLGNAFFLRSPVTTQITFVGEVATGDIANSLATGLNVVANKVPVDERWPGNRGTDGDQIYVWNTAAQSWDSAIWGFIDGFGWDNGAASTDVAGPMLSAGQGVIYSAKAPLSWTRSFNP